MISVCFSDERKGPGLGSVDKIREMEENELEEREACPFDDNDDFQAKMDPDIAFSYIDEKLQNVLGHLQKDFEGGASAEKLGPKYGGYGSFLPTYALSPVHHLAGTQEELKNKAASRSPNTSQQPEGAQSCNTVPLVSHKAKSVPNTEETNQVSKQKSSFTTNNGRTPSSGLRIASKVSSNTLDHKPLIFRIKVDPDNLSAQKKAAIYSGLGLGVSPNSSLDSSPSEYEGLHEPSDAFSESPMKILKVMTSLPLLGDPLLSPLSEDLLHLSQETVKESKYFSRTNFGLDISCKFGEGSDSTKFNKKLLGNNREKLGENGNCSSKSNGCSKRSNLNEALEIPGKDVSNDILARGELNSNAPQPPFLSVRHPTAVGEKTTVSKVSGAVEKRSGRNTDVKVDTSLHLDGRIGEDRKLSTSNGHLTKISKPVPIEPFSRSKKSQKVDQLDSCKQDSGQDNMGSAQGSSKFLLGKKKGSQNLSRDASKLLGGKGDSSSLCRIKPANVDKFTTRDEMEELKSNKNRTGDTYKTFFADVLESKEGGQKGSFEKKCSVKVKGLISSVKSEPKGRMEGKKSCKNLTSEKQPSMGSNSFQLASERFNSEAAPAPFVVEDHWVCCDKCQKWRLLPIGMDPNTLPDKWTCSMLHWLPAMNRCSVSQDETTNALMARYQLPVVEAHALPPQNSMGSDIPWANTTQRQLPCQDLKSLGVKAALVAGKRKRITKEISEPTYDESMMLPDWRHKKRNKESQKGRLKSKGRNAEGGDLKALKVNSQSRGGPDLSGPPSTVDAESLHFPDEEWASDTGGHRKKRFPTLAGNDGPRNVDNNWLDKKAVRPQAGVKKSKRDFQSFQDEEINKSDSLMKRKLEESKATDVHNEDGPFTNEEICVSDQKKDKKARVSKSDGKTIVCKEKGQMKILQSGKGFKHSKQKSLDKHDSSKKDNGMLQSSFAALSSSSKVSGSQKNRTSIHELKGSPVESVSSSPLRASDVDKLTSAMRSFSGKGEHVTKNFFASDGEDFVVSDRHGTSTKEKIHSRLQCESHVPSEAEFQDKPNKMHFKANNQLRSSVKGPSSLSKGKNQGQVNSAKPTVKDAKAKVNEKHDVMPDANGAKSSGISKDMGKISAERGKMNVRGNNNSKIGSDRANQMEQVCEVVKPFNSERMSSKVNDEHTEAALTEAVPKSSKHFKSDNQGLNQHISSELHEKIGHGFRKLDDSRLQKKESPSQVAVNALREAKDLKHLADRRKNAGSNDESTRLYFQAALKFLYGASMLESCGTESAKHGEMTQSMHMYRSTAKLCQFCAHEFEKSKHMAFAALAYKCVEVAYMRVVYSSHGNGNRLRHDLQTALQMVPPGESPSSSASDVDNLTHPTTADRMGMTRGAPSPQISGNNLITAQNRSSLVWLLKFIQDVNLAMDATRKAQNAFGAAAGISEEFQDAVKRALDFNFQDVDGLLHLTRIAIEAIND